MLTSFLIVLSAILVYGGVHSWLASLMVKARLRHKLGDSSDRWFRLAYNIIAVLTLLPVLLLPVLLPDHELYRIPWPWLILSIAGQVLALAMMVAGLMQTGLWSFLGLRQLVQHPEQALLPPRLITGGLYRWVRHPLYSAVLLFIWLLPVMTSNLLALSLGITVYILVGAVLEERKLRKEFGESYIEYQRRTPMLIPGLILRRR